jgi:hypothetical protein
MLVDSEKSRGSGGRIRIRPGLPAMKPYTMSRSSGAVSISRNFAPNERHEIFHRLFTSLRKWLALVTAKPKSSCTQRWLCDCPTASAWLVRVCRSLVEVAYPYTYKIIRDSSSGFRHVKKYLARFILTFSTILVMSADGILKPIFCLHARSLLAGLVLAVHRRDHSIRHRLEAPSR